MELEPHSDQRLDQDDEEREEMDSELKLEIDYTTELQQQDQTGTLHIIKILEKIKKAAPDLILLRPGQQLKFRLRGAKVESVSTFWNGSICRVRSYSTRLTGFKP